MIKILWVAVGGAAGAVLRYLITLLISLLTKHSRVYTGTVFVNITGCFLAGILFGYLANHPPVPDTFILFFSVGLLGSLTTFSAFALELRNLLHKPLPELFTYLLLQLGASTVMAALGIFIGKAWTGGSVG